MASGILGTAVSSLMVLQRSLQTVSNNIANVNTEGYSRQRVELGTNASEYTSSGYLGKGVKIKNIVRSYDEFITTQLRSSTSAFGDANRYQVLSSQVDNLLADPVTGLSPAIKQLFNAVNDVADDPASIPARQTLLAEGETLTQRFSTMNGRLDELRSQVNSNINANINDINSFAKSIADLNIRIAEATSQSKGAFKANDLLDERDQLLNKLSKLVDVAVVPSNNNMVSVFIGKGQKLVLSGSASQVIQQQSVLDPTRLEIGVKEPDASNVLIVTQQLSGGEMVGALRFRDEVLNPAQQQLGAIAASVAMEFNKVHKTGFDLDGNAGVDFFSGIANVPVSGGVTNTGTISAAFDPANIGNITASDYRLDVSGAGPTYTLTRVSDNASINLTVSGGQLVASGTDTLPGITITLGATVPVAGDSFLIRPAYSAAKLIAVNITDPRKIAAASSQNASGGALPGDNRNALLLAALENKTGMSAGTSSFQQAYTQIVSTIGGLVSSAKVSASAQETLLNNAKEQWSSVSGVNLDEETADLIKLQQSYQASSQAIATTKTIFETLLNSVR